ncbi:MAG: hypothetical protein AB7T37_08625 [Dehalococcoidia bacterium]
MAFRELGHVFVPWPLFGADIVGAFRERRLGLALFLDSVFGPLAVFPALAVLRFAAGHGLADDQGEGKFAALGLAVVGVGCLAGLDLHVAEGGFKL